MKNTNSKNPLWRRTSRWLTPLAVATGVFMLAPNAQAQFPEGFEAGVPPAGWATLETGPDATQFWQTNASAHSGAAGAYVRYSAFGATNEDYLITPQFTPGAGEDLSFWEREAFGTDYGSTFSVLVSTTTPDAAGFGANPALWTRGETPSATAYTIRTVSLAGYVGTPIYLAFVNSNNDGDSWYVDDVDVAGGAVCGDLICNGAETFATCPGDCPATPGSCDAPIALTSGVALVGETSCGSGVNLPNNACSGLYASAAPAEALVYSYTTGAGASEDITVLMSNIVGSYSGLSMISGTCNDAGATCLGFVGNSATTDRTFVAAGVPASTTVHIYVTTWPTPNCVTNYDLLLTAVAGAVCGDMVCDPSENFGTCPGDCPAAPGEDCSTAIDVSAEGTFASGVVDGIYEGFESCMASAPNAARWFVYSATANGTLNVSSFGIGGTDSQVAVGTGTCGALVEVACNDDFAGAPYESEVDFPVTSGTDYYIMWGNGWSTTDFDFTVTFSPPPPCAAPTATRTAVPNCPAGFDVDVDVTAFGAIFGVPETSATIEYTVNAVPQTPVAVGSTGITTLTGFISGDVVVVTVTNDGDNTCDLTLASVTFQCPPVNDVCAGAIALDCNTITTGTTEFATQADAPTAGCDNTGDAYVYNAGGRGVWYTVAGFDGPMYASLCGSSFDTQIWVGTDGCGAQVCVAGNDDAFGLCSPALGSRSRASWTGSSAETYYIYVTGWATNFGVYELFVGCGSNNNSCPENGLAIEFQSDNFPNETTWDLLDGSGQYVVASGGPLAAPGALLQEFACVPDGCYQFRVNDTGAGSAGMSTGGYVVRTQGTNIRIIDNANNFSSGTTSQAGGAFCLPMGTTELLYSSCDKYFWANGEYIVCNEDAGVASDWNGGGAAGADSGYDFWFYNPNGGYSYVRSRRHNVSDNYANVGSSRTCHMKINNWAAANHIPNGVLMNVRVRPVVNGVAGVYGPACRFTRNEAVANCPPTLLFDVPGFPQFYSCGVNRDFVANTANRLYARPVGGATQYRFTFDNAELASPIVRVANNYYLTLGWSAAAAPPLVPGQTYDVTVEAFKGGSWCIPGNVCLVTINNAVAGGQQNVALDGGSALNMWPNPSNGDVLNMSLLVADPFITSVSMDIFDLSGKRMIARTVGIQDGLINTTIDLNGDLADGMYMVKVTAGEEVFTQRVVIQK